MDRKISEVNRITYVINFYKKITTARWLQCVVVKLDIQLWI